MNSYQEKWGQNGIFELYENFRKALPRLEDSRLVDGIIARGIKKINNVLDVGGGSGDSSLEIISLLNDREIIIKEWEVMDVSVAQLVAFGQRVSGLATPCFSFTHCSWSDFVLEKDYSLVLSLHSWYGIGLSGNSLVKFVRAISKDGLGVIVVVNHGNVLEDARKQIQGGEYRISGEEICREFCRLGIEFEWGTANLPIPALLDANGSLTKAAEGIYPFIFNVVDLSNVREDLVSYLSKWIEVNGEWFSSVDFVWIKK